MTPNQKCNVLNDTTLRHVTCDVFGVWPTRANRRRQHHYDNHYKRRQFFVTSYFSSTSFLVCVNAPAVSV